MSHFEDDELSRAELERLAILSEELGEAQQCIGKIIRHGYESYNPVVNTGMTNRQELVRELGDIMLAIELLCRAQDISSIGISNRVEVKRETIKKYLHWQQP